MNPNDKYVKDDDELVFTGKKLREYRNICRQEGYVQCKEECINLVLQHDECINVIDKIKELKLERSDD
jgi:hypothetical protein